MSGMIVGAEPLSMEETYPEFRAPRAYTEPEEAELVSVNVARVVGIVDPGDHALDESIEGRSVRIYYEVPIVIGKRVPWIDKGSRRYAAHTKQQQSLLRWKTLEVEKLECAVSKRTRGSDNTIAVTRARSHVADQLCHRYSRPGYRVCDCEQIAAWRLPSPLLGNAARSDSPALQRPVLRRSQMFQSRNRAAPQSPIAVRARRRRRRRQSLRRPRGANTLESCPRRRGYGSNAPCAPTVTWPQSSAWRPKRCAGSLRRRSTLLSAQ